MKLTEEEIQEKLANLRGWEIRENQLAKSYQLSDFSAAMKLANQIAMIAENSNHHPDILIQYNKITFILSTHSEDGITQKDFELAKQIESTAALI